jgi:hypothetical protein
LIPALFSLFSAYVTMDETIQEAIRELVTALIKSMGSSNVTLLGLLRHFPPGAETLALRVVNIFTSGTRPSTALVSLVKTLVTERDLGSEFIIPIIGEMDKVCVCYQYDVSTITLLAARYSEAHTSNRFDAGWNSRETHFSQTGVRFDYQQACRDLRKLDV